MFTNDHITCGNCNKPIDRGKYCSHACRQKAYRARQQEKGSQGVVEQAGRLELLQAENERLEAEIKRLQVVLDVETRFRLDTQARFLQAWLKKQTFEPGSLYQQFKEFVLAEKSLPQKASRAAYEAHLRRLCCKDQYLAAFQDLWKAMLLQS